MTTTTTRDRTQRTSRFQLERDHGAELDQMPEAERDQLAQYVFGNDAAVELARAHAPTCYRVGLLTALATNH